MHSCSGESLYFKLPSFDKCFAWRWPFLGFASLQFSFVFVFVIWTNCICCVLNLEQDDKCLAWQCTFQPWLSLIAAINIFLSFSRPFPCSSTWTNWNVWIWFTFCSYPLKSSWHRIIYIQFHLILLVTIWSTWTEPFLTQYILEHQMLIFIELPFHYWP